MAISILTQGGAVGSGTSASPSVTLTAGAGNRRLIVAIAEETIPPGTWTITYGGVGMSTILVDADTTDGAATVRMFELLEASLPANGARTLSMSATAAGDWAYYYWIIDGATQAAASVGFGFVANAGAAGTTISTGTGTGSNSPTVSAAGAIICAGAYKNNSTSTVSMTAPASSTTDQDVAGGGASSRLAFGHKLGSLTPGTVTVTFTHDSVSRRCVAAYVAEPAASGPTISGAAFAAGSATMAATAVRGHPVSSAGFAAQSATMAATGVRGHPVSTASFTAGSATMAATASRGRSAAAASQASSASFAAAAVLGHPITAAAFQAGSASFAATLLGPETGTGDGGQNVDIPHGTAGTEIPGNGIRVRVPRGAAGFRVE